MGEVADRIVASVRELLGGTTAIVFQRDPATGHHTALATSGDGASAFIGLTTPAGTGAIGLAVRDGRPIVTPDVTADPRILLPPEIRKRIDQTPMRAVVAVPLVTQGRSSHVSRSSPSRALPTGAPSSWRSTAVRSAASPSIITSRRRPNGDGAISPRSPSISTRPAASAR